MYEGNLGNMRAGGPGVAATAEARQPQMLEQIEAMHLNVKNLAMQIEGLDERLLIVSRSNDAKPDNSPVAPVSALCAMADQLRTVNDHLNSLFNRVCDIRTRLEI